MTTPTTLIWKEAHGSDKKIQSFQMLLREKEKSFKFSDLVVQPDGEPLKPAGAMEQVIYCILEIKRDWRCNNVRIFLLPAITV